MPRRTHVRSRHVSLITVFMTGRTQNIVVRPLRMIATILIIAGIILARDLLLPATLALLLMLLLQPLVKRLERLGMNHALSVILTVTAFLILIGSVAMLVADQMVALSLRLPDYRENLITKVRELRASGQGPLGRIAGTIKDLGEELSTSQPATAEAVAASLAETKPVPVTVVSPDITAPQLLATVLGPLIVPVVGAGATLLLLIFLLFAYDDLRSRLISWAGMRRISLTTSALNEITQRVSRFVRMQLIVNVTYGTMVALGLWAFGVPQALLWGVMGSLLRFVPYVGPWLSAILPTLLAIAIFPGWSRPLGVAVMFILIEGVTNLVLEPLFYCSGTGLSSLGVVCASIFWGWAWGPVGLLLAVPTTVCLTVIGKYLPQLSLLNQLFGTDVDVPKVGQVYQDLLVSDAAALDRTIDEELETRPIAEICDDLLLPALVQLKKDLSFGAIDVNQARRAMRTLEHVVALAVAMPPAGKTLRLLCIAGQTEVDACAARLLAIACRAQGVTAEALSSQVLVSEAVNQVTQTEVEHIAIVQVIPASIPHSKRFIKALAPRLHGKRELINLVVGDQPAAEQQGHNFEPARSEHTFTAVISPLAEQETVTTKEPAPATKIAV